MERVLGDVDGDNRITKMDLLLIQAHLFGKIVLTEEQQRLADVTFDGYITLDDVVAIANHLRGIEVLTEELIM